MFQPAVAKLSNWLVIGPFAGDLQTSNRAPSNSPLLCGQLYEGNITWTIPKVEVFADVIDPRPYWGTYYNWNYHTGGVAWAMSHLSAATGEKIR